MMLCNDMSGGLPSAAGVGANGQSQCQMDAPPMVNAKTRDLLLDPAPADHRLPPLVTRPSSVTRPSPGLGESRPKKTITPSGQSDWHLNFEENRSRNTENPANSRPEISEAMNSRAEKVTFNQSAMDVVLVEPNSPVEARTMKRFANCMNSPNPPSHVAKKRMKLDAAPRMKLDAAPMMFVSDPVGQTNALAQEHWKKGALGYLARDVRPSSSEPGSKEKVKISKDSLSQHLNHIDSLIVQHEMALARLHTTLEQLEEAMPKSGEESENREKEIGGLETKPQLSEAEHVLAENRRKAETSHAFMNKMKLMTESFLYQRPSDTAVYHENKHKFMVFKKRLVTFMKNKREAENTRAETLKKDYNDLHVAWRKKMEMVEKDQKQSTRKVREYFDKIFPEMKKQEEEQLQRYCSTVLPSSESDGLNKDQKETVKEPEIQMEMVMEKLRSLAAHPPHLLDRHSRRLRFLNENGLIEEPAAVNSASMLKCSFWTEPERDLFVEKYVRHPKKFGLISSCLESKNIRDCVQFYYLTKKAVGYKKLQRQKYSRKPKMRGANNAKEDKAESKNSGVHACRERHPPSGSIPTSAVEPGNQTELDPAEAPLLAISIETDVVVEQVEGGSSSFPIEPSAQLSSASPPESSSLISLNPPSPDKEKKGHPTDLTEAAVQPLTPCDGRPVSASDGLDSVDPKSSNRLQSPLKDLQELVQDSCKADDDDDSVATLSADEGATHSQEDENCDAQEDAPTLLPTFPAQVQTATEQPSQTQSIDSNRPSCRSDSYSSGPLQRDTEAVLPKNRLSAGKDGSRREVPLSASSSILSSEMRGFVKPGSELDDRSKGMPNLLPLGLDARGTSPQVGSPSVGNESSAVLPVAGLSSFVRNSGSPARIRDLIHAAIKKTLQVSDRKPSEAEENAKRNADPKKFNLSSEVAYKPPAICGSVGELEAEDLSVRHPRRISSAAETPGKVLQPKNVPCQPPTVDSPYHLRPAHSNPPSSQHDPRSGYLLELAIIAEFENMKRSERERQLGALERESRKDTSDRDIRREAFGLDPRKETFERDPRKEAFEQDPRKLAFERDHRKEAFERDAHSSGRFDFPGTVEPAEQVLRRREAPMHKGSIMRGTPVPPSRFHAPTFPAEALEDHFGPPSSSAGRNSGALPEPSSRLPFHPTVSHISSEHMELLCDDFQTAQQLRNMQKAPSVVEHSDRDLTPYQRPYQSATHATFSGQSDPRMELYQPSNVGAFPGCIPNNLSVPPRWQQHPAVRLSESHAYAGDMGRGSDQRPLLGSRAVGGPSNHAMTMPLRNGPFDSTRGGYLADKGNSDGMAPSQWPIPPNAPVPVRFSKGSCLPEQNWPKISEGCSAAQLIEWIISIQISQPDAADKGIPASILNRIEETSSGPLSQPWSTPPPTTFHRQHDELRMARDMMSTAPRMAIPDRATTSGGRAPEKNFQATATISEGGFSSRSEIPDRGFSSATGFSDRVLSSMIDVPNKTFLPGQRGGVSGHGAEKRDSNQAKRVTTVENCMENIYMELSRDSSSQSSTDTNRIAMRTFLSGSDQTSFEDVHQTDAPQSYSRLNRSLMSSSHWVQGPTRQEGSSSSSEPHPPDKVPSSQRAGSEVDDRNRMVDGVGCHEQLGGRRSAASGFNWKTKILREHQKQQMENEDRNSPLVASPSIKLGDHENKLSERQQLRRLSSSDLLTRSVGGETASAVSRPDDSTLLSGTASRLSSPGEGRRTVLGGTVQDDHESPIAGKHQTISTLLSSRSGRIIMPVSTSSSSSLSSPSSLPAATGPVPLDSQLSKQTVARDSTPCNRSDKTDPCPAPSGDESPDLDSPGTGRLCIHLDSTEGLKSPSPS